MNQRYAHVKQILSKHNESWSREDHQKVYDLLPPDEEMDDYDVRLLWRLREVEGLLAAS